MLARPGGPAPASSTAEFVALKQESRILVPSSNPVCGFSRMEQVRLGAVWPMENCPGSSFNQIQGWATVRESYSHALERGPLLNRTRTAVILGCRCSLLLFSPCLRLHACHAFAFTVRPTCKVHGFDQKKIDPKSGLTIHLGYSWVPQYS